MKFEGSVLLVDDEAHIRKFIGLILKQLGVSRLLEAADGEEALEIYGREKPDLVVLDINMPAMDGLETLRELRKINPDCAVVMLTSLASRKTVDETLELGAMNYIRKDTPKEEISKALAEALGVLFGEDPAP